MKNSFLLAGLLAVCFASCREEKKTIVTTTETDTTLVTTSEVDTTTAGETMDSAAIDRAWKDYMTPGAQHKMLADETGSWNVTLKFWMSPDAKPQTDKATAEAKMIMDGRYQEVTYKGTMMGTPWEGKNTVAFNNKTGMFTSTFIDNSGTGMMVATGIYDEPAKAVNYKGESVDPITGKTIRYREVYTIVDAKTRKMEMFDTKGGQPEYKSMEIVMTRK
ncbi:DUF1579 domain-containing protein [Flavobacterium psychrotrophum]|uniref:DUF1579 domain-containing protein n=1 Tax=Flavobacterium psychrotrophum TaxID=2294119 RepID=UPI000E318F3A|nr:DUF1579 domain-containing protein [Flavobacterium psychrotrophum]